MFTVCSVTFRSGFAIQRYSLKKTVFFEWSPPLHTIFWHISWHAIIWMYLWNIICIIYIYIYSDILSGSFWHMYLAHLLSFFLTFYLVYLRRFFVVEVRQGTLWSGACGGGAAGNTLIQRLLLGSGGERGDLELAVEARRRKEEGGRRRAGWHKISQPSPDRWGKTEVFQNGTRICYVLSVLPALAAVTFEQHGVIYKHVYSSAIHT